MKSNPLVSIVMGSDSDLLIMKPAAQFLEELGIPFEITFVSAHRTPDRLYCFAKEAQGRGVALCVAGTLFHSD